MNALVEVKTRLPYNPELERRFAVTPARWQALCDAIYPAAKTPEAIELALSYCEARNLDIMKRPVHIVPVWSSALGKMVEGVWPGISELRTTAMRTKQYAGCDKTVFGPMVEHKFRNGATLTFPEWAQKTVYKMVGGQRVAFEGPEVYWLETYATEKKDTDVPNSMWRKRPRGQLDKCAEAAALRCAFPEEIGDEMTAEEMAGKVIGPVTAEPAAKQVRTLHAGFDTPALPTAAVEPEEAIEAEFEDQPTADDPVPLHGVQAWADHLMVSLPSFTTVDALRASWDGRKDELRYVLPDLWKTTNKAVAARAMEIGGAG